MQDISLKRKHFQQKLEKKHGNFYLKRLQQDMRLVNIENPIVEVKEEVCQPERQVEILGEELKVVWLQCFKGDNNGRNNL